jgi:hypothetical protein
LYQPTALGYLRFLFSMNPSGVVFSKTNPSWISGIASLAAVTAIASNDSSSGKLKFTTKEGYLSIFS